MNIRNVSTRARPPHLQPARKKERKKEKKQNKRSLPLITARQTFIVGVRLRSATSMSFFYVFVFTSKRSRLAKEAPSRPLSLINARRTSSSYIFIRSTGLSTERRRKRICFETAGGISSELYEPACIPVSRTREFADSTRINPRSTG